SLLQFATTMENIDQNKLKQNLLMAFVVVFVLINRRNLIQAFLRIKNRKKKIHIKYHPDDHTYSVYKRYEEYLKKSIGEIRKLTDTDKEVLYRLRNRNSSPPETLAKMQSFLQHYQAVRFGEKRGVDLESIISSFVISNSTSKN